MITTLDLRATTQYKIMMNVFKQSSPELYLKLLGTDVDIDEFHHILWKLPFYQKMIEISNGMNTTRYIYISDRNCSSNNLFFMYELTFKKYTIKGTHSIEKRIIDVCDDKLEYISMFNLIYGKKQANNVPTSIWNYATLL